MYTIPEECPARISHNTDTYLAKDNLFNKAKSLETGEILISEEFSFEDIPEGTPLEDPIYENLMTIKDITHETENDQEDANISNNTIKTERTDQYNAIKESNSLMNANILDKGLKRNPFTRTNEKLLEETTRESSEVTKVEGESKIDNPNLSGFHVIDSEKDLEFPTGVEGPVPSVVLPPKDFVFRPTGSGEWTIINYL